MRKSRTMTVCTALAASALVAALPVSAEAKKAPSNGVKQAVFKATLSGSQVTTWEYHHKAEGGCDANTDGYGDQTIKFGDNKKTFKVTFSTPPKKQPNLFFSDGRPAVTIEPLFHRLSATADRNSDVTFGAADTTLCPGDNGGADPGYKPPEPDCGMRYGSFQPHLYFHDESEDPDDLFVPLPGATPEKNHLSLDGRDWMWATATGSPHSELRNTYETCPFLFDPDTVDDFGNIYISQAKLSEKALFNKKRKKIVVSGHHIGERHSADSKGKTILAWNLRLTRVK
jgi:hypothetical protein